MWGVRRLVVKLWASSVSPSQQEVFVTAKTGFDTKHPKGQTAFLLDRFGVTLVVDVGANRGQYARGLRDHGYGGRIVSLEPLSEAHAALEAAAAGDPAWTVAPRAAVGASAGTATINVSASSDMSSALAFTAETERHFASDRFVAAETVPQTTVDAVLAEHARPGDRVFLKSDTQGFELEVLKGAAASLPTITGLQLEVSLHPIYQGQPGFADVLAAVAVHGFAIHQVIPGYFSRHHGRMLEMDAVLFREG